MSIPFHERPYRRNVAAVVINLDGLILACRRTDFQTTWQLPQGGIDAGETEEQALYRELTEEIGTAEVDVLGRLEQPIRYDWPPEVAHKNYRGQEQTYFLVRLRDESQIDFQQQDPPEFDQYEWLTATDFLGRLDRTAKGGFKFLAYSEALNRLQQIFPGLIQE